MDLCIKFLFCSLLLSFLSLESAHSKVDLYISREELNRTLGLNAHLHYVQDGVVNRYAVEFPFLVNENVSHISFLWKNNAQYEIEYRLWVKKNKESVVHTSFSIPSQGHIPHKLSALQLFMRCTGKADAEVLLTIFVSYTWPSKNNQTNLQLARRKICKKGLPAADADRTHISTNDEEAIVNQDASVFYNTPSVTAARVFYIALGCVAAFVVVVASLVITYFFRTKKPPPSQHQRYTIPVASPGYCTQTQPFIRTESPSTNSKYSAYTGNRSSMYSGVAGSGIRQVERSRTPPAPILRAEPCLVDTQLALRALEVDRNAIELQELIMEGTFGEMLGAVCKSGDDEKPDIKIFVKTVKRNASEAQYQTFLNEGLAFFGLEPHMHLCQTAAVAFPSDEDSPILDAPLLCYTHEGFGNMKKFLLRCRGLEPGSSRTLRTQDVVFMGIQLLKGLHHLHSNGIVHKDLAARNCLVGADLTVQICDMALSRDLFPGDYHCLGDNENRPVKWLAPEALTRHDFSSASDVWAFGVTMWEVLSGGQQPYSDVDPEEMASFLVGVERLHQPYNCPDELFGVLYCCWTLHVVARPGLRKLLDALHAFYTQVTEYI